MNCILILLLLLCCGNGNNNCGYNDCNCNEHDNCSKCNNDSNSDHECKRNNCDRCEKSEKNDRDERECSCERQSSSERVMPSYRQEFQMYGHNDKRDDWRENNYDRRDRQCETCGCEAE